MAFLRGLLRHLRGKVVVAWGGGSNHEGPLVRALLARYRRLPLVRLPAHAPYHNPAELVWSYLKHGRMANFVPRDVKHLDQVVQEHLAVLGGNPGLNRALWSSSKLPLLDKNPST